MSAPTAEFMSMINSKPDLTKYRNNLTSIKNLTKAIINPAFGGSVLQPVGKLGTKRDKKNPLYEDILLLEPQMIYGGGYYVLSNIRESEKSQAFYDIYMLVPQIESNFMRNKVKAIHQHS